VRLARASKRHGKYRILAFDKHYRRDGTVDLSKTNMYVPNHYIVELARQYSDIFLPVISLHPYRRDAVDELEKWAKAGVKYIKWLPNAMGMDPADSAIEPFYRKMKEHNMILLSHSGEEQAVEAAEDQELGNPLRLRKPLDMGIRVIVAHAASLGSCADLDNGTGKKFDCFELFLRLMDEAKYRGLVFGEISAMLQFNRMPGPLSTLLQRQDLHPRLVNGSDYPLPAINALIRTRSLASDGFITKEERSALNEIYDYNPLLFDFALKRTIRHPQTKQKLAPSVFMENPGLENYFGAKWKLVAHTAPGAVFIGSSVQRYGQKFERPLGSVVSVATENQPADPRLARTVFAEYPQRENFLLAAAWWRANGFDEAALYSAARTFKLGRHRLARVAEHERVTFWNDSKATNFHAVEAALAGFNAPVVLIAGGKSKGGDLAGFVHRIAPRVKHIVLIGETSAELAFHCSTFRVAHTSCANFAEAVRRATELADPGDHVLLSPGFASFDMFRNYEDRGDQFEALVQNLNSPAASLG